MNNPEYDYLIIGQGLAGSILGYSLIKRGLRVMVVDNLNHRSSSQVAAGIINPITGHRFNLCDGFDQYYPAASRFYRELENELKIEVFAEIAQQRLIKNIGQLNYYQLRSREADYQNYMGRRWLNSESFPGAELGAVDILQTATVNCKLLLATIRSWLRTRRSHRTTLVSYQSIKPQGDGWQAGGISASNLIFCEGHQAIQNPWLKDLPFKLSKGEILTLELEDVKLTKMLNWGHWLIPEAASAKASGRTSSKDLPTSSAKLGSNFVWNDISLKPSATTRTKLLDSLLQATNISARVSGTEIGIRPTTLQRHPFVGPLKAHQNAYCFNGFGSKGCLLIPHYAKLMGDYLLKQQPLPEEVTRWL